MSTKPQTPTQPAPQGQTTPRRPGPVPLDPSLFRHVAGGLPRGGWASEV